MLIICYVQECIECAGKTKEKNTNPKMSNAADESKSSPDPTESDIYDRQIRLWGADAQERINKARVLYVNITGVS